MKHLTILVDMDDTIEDLVPAWVGYLNQEHGTSVKPENVTDWDMSKFFPSLNTYDVYAPLGLEEMWQAVKPKQGALRYLRKLKDDGHQLLIVTSCPCTSIMPKMRWVFYEYLDGIFDWDDVIITSHKQRVRGDILIDDGVHNHTGGAYFSILMDASHNRSFDAESNGMVRVKTWEEIYTVVCDFAERAVKHE
jgi:5'(3')-deoxyribonucleotidase